MAALKIYLCDLTHDTIVLVTDTFPLNVGLIGSYAKTIFGDDIDITLFKYPDAAVEAIVSDPPDVIALSNYSWNSHLSEAVAGLAKKMNPLVITVQGGTNFPNNADQQLEFLLTRPNTDVHTHMEGEIAFANIVRQALDARDGGSEVFSGPIEGCVYIEPTTRSERHASLVSGPLPLRIKDFSMIPSPYLNGMFDPFFDGRLTPFIETNRGCPFECSFCHTGEAYFQKINMYSIERISEEVEYIAQRIVKHGIVNLHIADTNFGMYKRDREITQILARSKKDIGWPLRINCTTGKNNKQRVLDVTEIMGDSLQITMAVQSMDQTVLKTIRRSNIRLKDYMEINRTLRERGLSSIGEIILGLPGETKESFLKGIEEIVESGVPRLIIYTLMLLEGTEFKDPVYRERHGIVGKYRIVPLNFSEIDGELVFDYEEVGIASNTLSFDDYLYLRGFALIVETLHNDTVFEPLFRYALSLGASRFEVLRRAYDSIATSSEAIHGVMNQFLAETKNELWDSESDLIEFYRVPENVERLSRGDVGGNLIYKYKGIGLTQLADEWISFLAGLCTEILEETTVDIGSLINGKNEIVLLEEYCANRMDGMLTADGSTNVLKMESDRDVTSWLAADPGAILSDYGLIESTQYEFFFSDEQVMVLKDFHQRYGTDVNALSKTVVRVNNVAALLRQVRSDRDGLDGASVATKDQYTRYGMAH